MPLRKGFTVTHFITVADMDRSTDFYEKVFGGRVMSRGDSKGASGHIQIANTWLIAKRRAAPTPDKPSVTLSVPTDPDKASSVLNIRVAVFRHVRSYGKVGEPSSSQSRRKVRREQLFDKMTELLPSLGSESVVVDVRIPGHLRGTLARLFKDGRNRP